MTASTVDTRRHPDGVGHVDEEDDEVPMIVDDIGEAHDGDDGGASPGNASSRAEASGDDDGPSVRIRLRDGSPGGSHPLPTGVAGTEIAVPSSLRRRGLSAAVNHLLGGGTAVPFDFLVGNRYLRTSLEGAAGSEGFEAGLDVTYVPLYPRPEEEGGDGETLPDWVSCLAAAGDGVQLAGCYDGSVRLVGAPGGATAVAAHGGAPVKCLVAAGGFAASGGMDHAVVTYRIADGTLRREEGATFADDGFLAGSVTAIGLAATEADGYLLGAGDVAGSLCLWRAPSDGAYGDGDGGEDGGGAKRRKTAPSAAAPGPAVSVRPAGARASAHSGAVTGLFLSPDGHGIVTASLDRYVRTWDASRMDGTASVDPVSTYGAHAAVTCLAACAADKDVVA
eukprot:CAMPEP_0194269606 /NCGR_PEP_ID=MMETSP0169-20130528/3739_1 /TAXON_ID=218684 /ORGANISM="Corethron pennatum, Strain L29A3" /LENGTH=392 /DNA_ID=CAMNT_0039011307 /DNA_START=102 /DNA_END=1276 /DNA_ORIENTATION=-